LRGPTLARDFQKIVLDYIKKNYGHAERDAAE
jgi:(E)-4-hydroxy-3-methylbut-2-enyl-diphosphate synthase